MHRKWALVVAALALVAGACRGSKDTQQKASVRATTTTTAPPVTGTAAPEGATSTTGPSKATAPTTAASKPAATTTTANTGAAPAPAAPGTYDYAQSGSTSQGAVPPKGTLVVSGAGPSQVFRRYVDPSGQPSDLYIVFRNDGPFLTKVVLRQQGVTLTCTFGSPVPVPPWPPTTGKSFSGQATCDNNFRADFSGSITGRSANSVGGKSYDVVVINSTLHATGQVFGQPVDITVKDTQHWAPELRVPTFSREVVTGNVSGDVTSTLLNASPR